LVQLNTCSDLIAEGYSSTGNMGWLNEFCATFLDFASDLKARLPEVAPSGANLEVETIFLCLTQVVTCITHLERTISLDASQMTRQHFLDRLDWCLRRMLISLTQLENNVAPVKNLEDHSFVRYFLNKNKYFYRDIFTSLLSRNTRNVSVRKRKSHVSL